LLWEGTVETKELRFRTEIWTNLWVWFLFCFVLFLAALQFELRASLLLGRHSYSLSHSISPGLICLFLLCFPLQPLRVRGCILTLVERMDEEFTKIMQNTDPHSQGEPTQAWTFMRGKVQWIILTLGFLKVTLHVIEKPEFPLEDLLRYQALLP
jgi:hypothetical protein